MKDSYGRIEAHAYSGEDLLRFELISKSNEAQVYLIIEEKGELTLKCINFVEDVVLKRSMRETLISEVPQESKLIGLYRNKEKLMCIRYSIWRRLIQERKDAIKDNLKEFADNINSAAQDDISKVCSYAAYENVKMLWDSVNKVLKDNSFDQSPWFADSFYQKLHPCLLRMEEYMKKKGQIDIHIAYEAIKNISLLASEESNKMLSEIEEKMGHKEEKFFSCKESKVPIIPQIRIKVESHIIPINWFDRNILYRLTAGSSVSGRGHNAIFKVKNVGDSVFQGGKLEYHISIPYAGDRMRAADGQIPIPSIHVGKSTILDSIPIAMRDEGTGEVHYLVHYLTNEQIGVKDPNVEGFLCADSDIMYMFRSVNKETLIDIVIKEFGIITIIAGIITIWKNMF